MQKAVKLHFQFAHPSKEKLVRMIKESKDFCKKEFIDCPRKLQESCRKCEICWGYKRPYSRLVMRFPLANTFNEVFCMDLKECVHNNNWILILIDSAFPYSAACFVKSKNKNVIVQELCMIWIAYPVWMSKEYFQ